MFTAVGARTAHSSNHGRDQARQKLADIFRPPHDLLFNGTFHEVVFHSQVIKLLTYNHDLSPGKDCRSAKKAVVVGEPSGL